MRYSAFKTGSCLEDEKLRLAVHKSHPAVTDRYNLYFSPRGTNGGFIMKRKSQQQLFNLTCLALLTAMQIVIARFLAIPVSESIRFSFSFIPVVIAARRFGFLGGMLVYGLGDFLGAIVFPTGGAYFPGFTLTAAVSGLIYGLYLGKKSNPLRIILSVLTSQILCTLLMNSYWVSTLYGSDFGAVFISRIPQSIVMSILQIVFMIPCLERICKVIKYR